MAHLSSLLMPWRAYGALRDQLGSVRGVYLAGDRVRRLDDAGDAKEVVVLLHGFFQTRNVWEVMEDRLRHDGYGVLSFNLCGLACGNSTPSRSTCLSPSGGRQARCIGQPARLRSGAPRSWHSKGGLIARRYVQHYGGDAVASSRWSRWVPPTMARPRRPWGWRFMGLGTPSPAPPERPPAGLARGPCDRAGFVPPLTFRSRRCIPATDLGLPVLVEHAAPTARAKRRTWKTSRSAARAIRSSPGTPTSTGSFEIGWTRPRELWRERHRALAGR